MTAPSETPVTRKAGNLGPSSSCPGTVGDTYPSLSFPSCQRRRLDTVAARSFQLSGTPSGLPRVSMEDADRAGGGGGQERGSFACLGPKESLRSHSWDAIWGKCVGGSSLSCLFHSWSSQVQEHPPPFPPPTLQEGQDPSLCSPLSFLLSRHPAAYPPLQGPWLWEADCPKSHCRLGGLLLIGS